MLTRSAHPGSPDTCLDSGSVSVRAPSNESSSTAVAVNCLDTDAMSNRVAVVNGVPDATSANPRALAHTTRPCIAAAAEQPGPSAGTAASTASLRAARSPGDPDETTAAVDDVEDTGSPPPVHAAAHTATATRTDNRIGTRRRLRTPSERRCTGNPTSAGFSMTAPVSFLGETSWM